MLAKSFERIHRSNLIAFGVLPIEWPSGEDQVLGEDVSLDISGLPDALRVDGTVRVTIRNPAATRAMEMRCRIDTDREAEWLRCGGVLNKIMSAGLATRS